ncbi:MAG: hypothetical protein WA476_05710 [Acidobacteriaceae bacterium]
MSISRQPSQPELWHNGGAMTLPRVPRRGERVRVDNHEGTFIVVRIDKIDGFANVELWNDPHVALWDVPFAAMRLIRDSVGEAA